MVTPEIPIEALRRARLGDRAAFRVVVEALLKFTYNLAYRMSHHAADAEDLTQEILMRLFQNLERYDPTQPFLPWFRTVAANCTINWRSRRSNRRGTSLDPARAPGVEDREPDTGLPQAIADLPPEYQVCLTLKYLEDLGVQEIAEAMKVPVGTVKTWLFRAREILKDRLKPPVERIL